MKNEINVDLMNERREALGLNKTQLLRQANIARKTFYDLEKGIFKSLAPVQKIAEVLGVDWKDLIIGNEN